jgi:hypothetical protein
VYAAPGRSQKGEALIRAIKKTGAPKVGSPGKHLLGKKPQYQIDEHYDDNHSYSDNDEVSSRHPHPFSSLLSCGAAPTNAQNSAKAGAPRRSPAPLGAGCSEGRNDGM